MQASKWVKNYPFFLSFTGLQRNLGFATFFQVAIIFYFFFEIQNFAHFI